MDTGVIFNSVMASAPILSTFRSDPSKSPLLSSDARVKEAGEEYATPQKLVPKVDFAGAKSQVAEQLSEAWRMCFF